jgi:hypothetical protein
VLSSLDLTQRREEERMEGRKEDEYPTNINNEIIIIIELKESSSFWDTWYSSIECPKFISISQCIKR